MAGKISKRDLVFIDEYLVDLDPKNAAIRAGYKPSTAREAYEWIRDENPTKPRVRDLILQKMAERARRTGVTADRVVRELAKIAFLDPTDVIDFETGELMEKPGRGDTSAIASVKIKETQYSTEREIKFADKNRALELLGKHLGMFKENVQISGAVPVIMDDIVSEEEAPEPEKKIGFDSDGKDTHQ